MVTNRDRVALVFLKGTDKAWAVKDCDTLEHALELAEITLYDEGVLAPGIPAVDQLEARWGYLFDIPTSRPVVVDDEPDPPEPPVWLTSQAAIAWKGGWAIGFQAGRNWRRE